MLLLFLLMALGAYDCGQYESSEEFLKVKMERMRTFPIKRVLNSLERASRNHKEGDVWDFNVIIPLSVISEKENAIEIFRQIIEEKEKYKPYIRGLAINHIASKIAKSKVEKEKINEIVWYLEKIRTEKELEPSVKKALAKILSPRKLLKWLNNANSVAEKWEILGYLYLAKPKVSDSFPLYFKVQEMAFDKNEHPKIRGAMIEHLAISFEFPSERVIKQFEEILADSNELDFLKGQVIYALGIFKEPNNIKLIYDTLLKSNSPFVWENCVNALAMIKNSLCDSYLDKLKNLAKDINFVESKQKAVNLYYANDNLPDLKKLGITRNCKDKDYESIIAASLPHNSNGRNLDVKDNFSKRLPKLYSLSKKNRNFREEFLIKYQKEGFEEK